MISSLANFLMLIFYKGGFPQRISWTLLMFTLGAVGIARVAIEKDRTTAFGYAGILGAAAFIAMLRFADSPIFSLCILFVIAYLSDIIVRDCTLIDDDVDASGQGLVDSGRLFVKDQLQIKPTAEDDLLPAATKSAHQPGRTVMYFAFAALPMFGLGQFFLRNDASTWAQAQKLLAFYLFSSLSLLVTTSFLGLRRYLRQRHVAMPKDVSIAWLVGGLAIIAAVLAIAFLAPLPGRALATFEVPDWLRSPGTTTASRSGWGNEAADKSSPDAPSTMRDPNATDKETQSTRYQKGAEAGDVGQGDRQAGPTGQQTGGKQPGQSNGTDQQSTPQESDNQQQSGQSKQQQSGGQQEGQQPTDQQPGSQQQQPSQSQGKGHQSAAQESDNQQRSGQSEQQLQGGQQQPQTTGQQKQAESGSQQPPPDQGSKPQQGSQPQQNAQSQQQKKNQSDSNQQESPLDDPSKSDPSKSDPSKSDPSKSDPSKSDPSKSDPSKSDPSKSDPSKSDPSKPDPSESDPSKSDRSTDEQPPAEDDPESQAENSEQEAAGLPPDGDDSDSADSGPSMVESLADSIPAAASLLKFLILVVLFAIVAGFVWINRHLIAAWWNSLLGNQDDSQVQSIEELLRSVANAPPRAFRSFGNPIGKEADVRRIIVITFQAFEAWTREHGSPRDKDETPSEFARRIAASVPQLAVPAEQLVDAYNRIVYGRGNASQRDVNAATEVWQIMSANTA
jgi:Domain of unknown function (DUF4129)